MDINKIRKCSACGSTNTMPYYLAEDDEIKMNEDGTGEYNTNIECNSCGNISRVKCKFKYEIISINTIEESE